MRHTNTPRPASGEQVVIYKLGSGSPVSVMQFVQACREVTGHPLPVNFTPGNAHDPVAL